jgi:hypothetical protein
MFIGLSDVRSPPFFSPLRLVSLEPSTNLSMTPGPCAANRSSLHNVNQTAFQFNALISAAIPHRFFNARSILYLPSPSKVEATERF